MLPLQLLTASLTVIGSRQRDHGAAGIMFVEAFADARHVGDDGDAERLQQARRSDARQLQKLRRIIGAGRQHDLARGARRSRVAADAIFDAGGAAALEQNARGQRVGHDVQIGAAGRRLQVTLGGRAAHAAAGRRLVKAGAFLAGAVEIVVARIAALQSPLRQRRAPADAGRARSTPPAARRRRAIRRRRARLLPPCENRAARRHSPSRHCRAGATCRSLPPGRGYKSYR